MEKWKQFYENDKSKYYVSDKGRIKYQVKESGEERQKNSAILKSGRKVVNINHGEFQSYLYRLVAEAFIPNPENKPTVNHKRGLDAGDGVDNLEWMTHQEQHDHAIETGLRTNGNTPAIVLDTNGEVISKHDTITNAMGSYDGKEIYHSHDIRIKGNVVVMKQTVYDELTGNEVFAIVSDCLNRVMNKWYVVDGQLYESRKETAGLVGRSDNTITRQTKNKHTAVMNGHNVSRVNNRIGVFNDG